LPFFAWYWIL